MPSYDYKCSSCGRIKEFIARIDQIQLIGSCNCFRKEEAFFIRMFSPPKSFILRGKGWYITEYGTKKDIKEDD